LKCPVVNIVYFCGKIRPWITIKHEEQIIPTSKGGKDKWDNVICACKFCNGKKGNKSLEKSGMNLLFLPYVPSHAEGFILSGRQIRADVLDFLMDKLPKGSRLL